MLTDLQARDEHAAIDALGLPEEAAVAAHLEVAEANANFHEFFTSLPEPNIERPSVADRLADAVASAPPDCTHITHDVVLLCLDHWWESDEVLRPRREERARRRLELEAAGYEFVGSTPVYEDGHPAGANWTFRIEIAVVRGER